MVNAVCRMAVVVEAAHIGSTPTEVAGRERGRGDESQAYMHVHLSTFAVHIGTGNSSLLVKMWYKDSLDLLVAIYRINYK